MGATTKLMPIIVLAIVIISLVAETAYNIEINLDEYMPILVALGVAGAAKVAIERAGQVKTKMPQNIKNLIDHETKEVLRKAGYKIPDGP